MMPSYVTTGYVTLAVSFSLSMAVLVSHCCYNKSTVSSFKPQRYTFSHFCMPESYINLFGWQSRLADLDTVLKSAFSCSFRLLATLSSFCCQGSVHVLLLPKQGGPILEFSGVSFWPLIFKNNNHWWNSYLSLRSIICLSLVFSLIYLHWAQQDHLGYSFHLNVVNLHHIYKCPFIV